MSAGNAAAAAAVEARRRRGIVAIKATQRALGIDDATYRTILRAQTGKDSCTQLGLAEQARVLDYLRRTYAGHPGAANPAEARRRQAMDGGRKRGTPGPGKAPLLAAVHALLRQLSEATGEPHSLNYADAICKRNGWAERVDFADARALHSLVGALSRTLRSKAAQHASAGVRPGAGA